METTYFYLLSSCCPFLDSNVFPVSSNASHVCNLELVTQTCWISNTLWENLPQTNSLLTSKVPTNKNTKHMPSLDRLNISLTFYYPTWLHCWFWSSFFCVHPRFVLHRVSGKYRQVFWWKCHTELTQSVFAPRASQKCDEQWLNLLSLHICVSVYACR